MAGSHVVCGTCHDVLTDDDLRRVYGRKGIKPDRFDRFDGRAFTRAQHKAAARFI